VNDWGTLPEAVRRRLRQLEWDNIGNLRARLLGDRSFPIRISLKPPTGRQALEAMAHFQAYMAEWRAWPGPGHVEYQTSNLSQIGRHDLPMAMVLEGFDELTRFLGPAAQTRRQHWDSVLEPLCALDRALYPCLVRNLVSLELLSVTDAGRLAATLAQLKPGLGRDNYLRALPLTGVDTKFVEQHLALLTELADALHPGAVSAVGGLLAWLGCHAVPCDWLYVRPLCEDTRRALGGIDLLQLSTATLLATPLPGCSVLIVENVAAGYALPHLPGAIAVFGGGANVRWTQAGWLTQRRLGYWGDIDTWGLHYLAAVRRMQTHVEPLLMDLATIQAHLPCIVDEKEPNPAMPGHLSSAETELYQDLLARRYGGCCLEQERLLADWVRVALHRWNTK
jgi:hypothetical protein